MEASVKKVKDLLHAGDQFVVPFFQRRYAWRRAHWQQLCEDIEALLPLPPDRVHFLGPLVCTPTKHLPAEITGYQLIDGQQRLTTLTVLLAALRSVCDDMGLGDRANEIRDTYLVHPYRSGVQRFKVVPLLGDREALIAVIDGGDKKAAPGGIAGAFRFFRRWVTEVLKGSASLDGLLSAVTTRLCLVVVTIDGENPYAIFESLNAKGEPLEESDLVRNFVFMSVPLADQESFHREQWKPFEDVFQQRPQMKQTDFYRDYLMKGGSYSRKRETYVDFKEHVRRNGLTPAALVKDLAHHLRFELMLRVPEVVQDLPVRSALQRVAVLDIATAFPLLMTLLARWDSGVLSKNNLLECVRDIESFVIRRTICGQSTRSYGDWFVAAAKGLGDSPVEELRTIWLRRGWPSDAALAAAARDYELYRRDSGKTRLILEGFERQFGHKEMAALEQVTIEHVMPQTIDDGPKGKEWKAMLGSDWRLVHERRLHTLGNLTLTGYNTPLGNQPYPAKRVEYAKSHLDINRYFSDAETWNEGAILTRCDILSSVLCMRWPAPAQAGVSIDIATDTGSRASAPESGRLLQSDFWVGFRASLRGTETLLKVSKMAPRSLMKFRTGRKGVYLWAEIRIDDGEVGVGMSCADSSQWIFQVLMNQRREIETQFGADLDWVEKASYSYVHLPLPGVELADRDGWPDLQRWMRDNLVQLCTILVPRVEALGQARPDEDA